VISLIVGENSFENERALERIAAEFDGAPEKIDGETLELKHLPDLLMGMSLFTSKRLVVIKNMSANKPLWSGFEEWIGRVSDDIHLVLAEAKPDKRTKTYKLLLKAATLYESKLWTERDTLQAEKWVAEESKQLERPLDKKSIQALVARVGVDQWALWQALQKLAVLDEVTPELIKEVIEPSVTENAFQLFESALKGDGPKVVHMLKVLQKTEDPYRLFGLLGGQAFQLAAISVAEVPDAAVAADLGVHPFVISKLTNPAKQLGKGGAKQILLYFAEADTDMKTSIAEPWLLIERALLKVAKTAR
jgi:DNA polymerase III delta subunit